MKVAWVGTYEPQFGRNRQLRRFMAEANVEFTEMRMSLWQEDRISALRKRKLATFLRSLWVYPTLFIRLLVTPRPDVYLVGYPGWFDVPIVSLAAGLKHRPVIFDPFISLFDTAVVDREILTGSDLLGRISKMIDTVSMRLATRVLADTAVHADFFATRSATTLDKFGILPVGADDNIFRARQGPGSGPGNGIVLFYGTFVPLQGVETIVRAAAMVDQGLTFLVIGDGATKSGAVNLARETGVANIHFLDPVPLSDLPDRIESADLCLGIFGSSAKADRVVPHKVYECMAAGRAIVTRDSEAVRTMLTGSVAVCPPEDPVRLAELITDLMEDPGKRSELAKAGFEHYRDHYTTEVLADALKFELARTLKTYAEHRHR